jgi:choline monooxygenase
MADSLQEKLDQFDASLPLERARTIPRLWYHDPEIYEAECRKAFSGGWQFVGRLDQLPGPGSYFTAEVAGEPILVLRDEAGTVRAFSNVCRHRAAVVMNEPCGKVSRLRCRYHGWTYDLQGHLRGVPEFDRVEEFCKEENGLVPFAVGTWGPFIWISLQPPVQPLAEYLHPIPQQTAELGMGRLHFLERREYELACNWKVFIDNYLDGGYHINTVHPGLADAIDYSGYRTETYAFASVQTGPLRPADASAVGSVRGGKVAFYGWVFPNFIINLYQDLMDTNWVLPLGPQRCRVVFDFYFADVDGPQAQTFCQESIAVSHQIQLEDQGISEDVQKGLNSRFYDTGRFSVRREGAGYHFHQVLAAQLKR